MRKKEVVVISVGGSCLVPDDIDHSFLKNLVRLIRYSKEYKFIIVVGGGKTARKYQEAGKAAGFDRSSLDWIGIYATWLNADIVRIALGKLAYKEVIRNPTKKIKFDNVLVAGGWKPGWSTDYDAVLLAETYGAKQVINMTNVDTLYDKDPRKYKNTKKILSIDWNGFKKIVGNKWKPGLNAPFDPIATKKAALLRLRLILVGKNIDNLKKLLDGKKFKGSVVD